MEPKRPNFLRSIDFITMPKSTPLGQVDINSGMDFPQLPQERPVDFVPVPTELQDNIMRQINALDPDKNHNTYIDVPRQQEQPSPEPQMPSTEMDFDLFQFTMIKDMIKQLDISIDSMESAIKHLTDKRDALVGLIKGDKNVN